MLQRTLDLLDAELRRGYDHYTTQRLRDRQKDFSRTFQVDPAQWKSYEGYFSKQKLTWIEFRYKDAVDANDLDARIPSESPGLYIFSARPDHLVGGFPQFALYSGISNDRDSKRPLRERLKDYFRLNTIQKRGNVEQMLQLYYPHVWVSCTLLNWPTKRLKKLETSVHEYLGVPFGTQAYEPLTKAARAAWDR
jgi:hypothetical protein